MCPNQIQKVSEENFFFTQDHTIGTEELTIVLVEQQNNGKLVNFKLNRSKMRVSKK